MDSRKFKTVEEYFSALPEPAQNILQGLRKTIKEAAPKAEEVISYNMPAFKLNGILVYYAAFKNHVSLFPAGSFLKPFKNELLNYKTSKGTIQFPMEKTIPKTLIKNIVKYRVKENLEKAKAKK